MPQSQMSHWISSCLSDSGAVAAQEAATPPAAGAGGGGHSATATETEHGC
eukprot:CAMPEP_0206137668 /NCGR_PEP_ID=MMETSP1473-20131121/2751_1 /ASSEMBLY_ACC=CAM_ASM_001109 /TAXON_ID=1461547 /ORGANISM="Stichococcus sp, Strain RCC1054" /LENGTH=49 /DNA_ID=CAMNT_0053530865 /DNA_START=490 /DNA_END=639 /DNA_ORIENTATION=+